MTIASNIRVPGSYNEVDKSGANKKVPTYRALMQIVAPRIETPDAWVAATAYALGAVVRPTANNDDGHYYICITAGTSHADTEPTWPGAGGSVTDNGTLVWREMVDASKIIDVNTPTQVFSPDDVALYAGAGSVAHRMAIAVFKKNKYVELWINLVDDAATGVKAVASLDFSGTADGSGSVDIYIGNDLIQYAWSDADTSAEIATAVDALIASYHDLPVTPDNAVSTVVRLIAKNAGVQGNEIGKYSVDNSVWEPVVVVTGTGITCTVTGFASGANNPDITDALDASASGAFKITAVPYRDATNLAALKAYAQEVSDEVNCRGVRVFFAVTSLLATATTFAGENYERFFIAFVNRCKYTSFEIAAEFAAMHTKYLPGKPLNTEALVGCDAPDISDTLEFNERNALLWAGVTPFNRDGFGTVRCIRSISTYTANSAGSPDDFYLDATTIACFDRVREVVKENDETRFSQKILRENHVIGEPDDIITPDDVSSAHFLDCKELEKEGTVQQVDLYKDRFTSVRSGTVAGRVDSEIPVEVVQGAHIFANTIRAVTSAQG